jgi:hypothetical protein
MGELSESGESMQFLKVIEHASQIIDIFEVCLCLGNNFLPF